MEQKPNTVVSLLAVIVAVVGIIVMFAYRAWLGGIIYIAAAAAADYLLRSCSKDENGKKAESLVHQFIFDRDFSIPEYISEGFKSKIIVKKILCGVVVLVPLVVLVAVIMWIFVDTNREAEDFANDVSAKYDEMIKDLM